VPKSTNESGQITVLEPHGFHQDY